MEKPKSFFGKFKERLNKEAREEELKAIEAAVRLAKAKADHRDAYERLLNLPNEIEQIRQERVRKREENDQKRHREIEEADLKRKEKIAAATKAAEVARNKANEVEALANEAQKLMQSLQVLSSQYLEAGPVRSEEIDIERRQLYSRLGEINRQIDLLDD